MKFFKLLLKTLGVLVLLLAALLASYLFYFSGSSHTPQNLHAATGYRSPAGPILVFGGNRGTGLDIVRKLRERGEDVTVALRKTSQTEELRALGVKTVIADALNADEVRAAFQAAPFVAVVSTLGTSRGENAKRPDWIGNRNVIDAARAAGVRRFVFITVIGAGDSKATAPWPSSKFLAEVMELKTRAEDHLRASGLAYTIIRPGGLGNVKETGTAVLAEDPQAFSYISRADLATLTVAALGDARTEFKTYSAYDPSRKVIWKMFND